MEAETYSQQNKYRNSDSWAWLLRSQSAKAKFLLLPLLFVALAFQWPPFTTRFPFFLKHTGAPEYPATAVFNPFSTNPVDGQLHLPNGKHYMLDFYGISSADLSFLETADGEAFIAQEIVRSGMTVLGSRSHALPGGGLSVVFLLSESHMSIHTWPEHSFAALDVYTCGGSSAADRLVDSLYTLLKPGASKVSYIERGSNHSHLVQVQREHAITRTVKVEATPTPSRNPTVDHHILLGTDRPRSLVLPAAIDICVNAGFIGDDCFFWRNASLLYSKQSEIQLVEVVDRQFGDRCLLLDGITQFCNSLYNELYTRALSERVMQPLLTSKGAGSGHADIYIVGGGDGWISTHLINTYPSLIRSVQVVDIDPIVAKVTQEFFPIVDRHDSFKDARVQHITADAFLWLHDAPDASADALIIDCTDHTVESANSLYTESFYSDVLRVLRPGGRFSQQMNTKDDSYAPFQQEAKESFLKVGFTDVVEWEVYIEDYGGVTVMMGGTKGKN